MKQAAVCYAMYTFITWPGEALRMITHTRSVLQPSPFIPQTISRSRTQPPASLHRAARPAKSNPNKPAPAAADPCTAAAPPADADPVDELLLPVEVAAPEPEEEEVLVRVAADVMVELAAPVAVAAVPVVVDEAVPAAVAL